MTSPTADESPVARDPLTQQAWEWLRLLNSGHATERDEQRFRQWLAASPAHRAVHEEVVRRWAVLRPAAGQLLRGNAELRAAHARLKRSGKPDRRGRRAFLGAAAGAVAAAGVAVAYPPLGLWPAPSEWGADYRTARGEQRTLALAEHVSVVLNTATSARRQVSAGALVGLELLSGEAAVDLAGGARSFAVTAGAGSAHAQSGSFDVRRLEGGKVCVTCVEGAVRLEHAAGGLILQARQQVVYDPATVGAATRVDLDEVSAWRDGILVFRHTRLPQVLDEINRYRPGRVVLMNDAARREMVTGHFRIASLDLALTQLQHVFGLDARALPGGVLILT
ncbi:transmembrane sensor [Bordetella ansorpii]|uniref:Transmembrane sensor n=1 Tax=Bordetella ansorpii TaxID=288768 RepID=A0A157S5N6_9BORD|nr:FecR domain-containing protein [Bordetella ansorpii]SAI65714.1 transmembrane sensor [Bordetella ansorpii]